MCLAVNKCPTHAAKRVAKSCKELQRVADWLKELERVREFAKGQKRRPFLVALAVGLRLRQS
jgi:hypothetical protein